MTPSARRGRTIAAIAATSLALALAAEVMLFGRPVAPLEPMRWVMATLAAVALIYSIQIWRGVAEPPEAKAIERLGALGAGPIVLAAALSGGLESPAAVLAALGAAAASRGRGATGAVSRGVFAFAALALGHLVLIGRPDAAAPVWTAAVVLGLGVFPEWQRERSAVEIAQARRRTERLEGWLGVHRPTPAAVSIGPRGSKRDVTLAPLVRDDEAHEREVLSSFLRDARDVVGGQEVIFWRWTPERDTLVPSGHSGDGPAPARFEESWQPLIEWSAREGIVHFDDGARPRLAVAPVGHSVAGVGVLSASTDSAFTMPPAELKTWLPRIAAHVAHLSELIETRQEYRRQNQQTHALLLAAQQFQSSRSVEALAQSICEAALRVTSAQRAVLVRWYVDRGFGQVQTGSGTSEMQAEMHVGGDSYVGLMCRNGVPQVWEDARSLSREMPVYSRDEKPRTLGSLAIVPLKRDGRVIGAIVVEGDSPRDVLATDARNIRLLAAVSTVSLETVWEIEEVSRRALTDQLTGMSNRRHFDEQLSRMLAEADRFGQPLSLIMADIDFFKKVNDTYGHEAGDQVLRRVATTIQDGVREVDVCARFGGEEIAVLLPQTTLAAAMEVAERLRISVEQRVVHYNGAPIRVTASFGVSTYPETARSRDAFFLSADKSLYQAKAEGRNRVRSAGVTPY